MDSICKAKNIKILDSYRFGRIRIQIPQAYSEEQKEEKIERSTC
jgi:hypothetical protein